MCKFSVFSFQAKNELREIHFSIYKYKGSQYTGQTSEDDLSSRRRYAGFPLFTT